MKLVIAEKPNAGIEIAKAIGAHKKQDGFMEGNNYVVTWCIGHLATLKEPQDYNEKFKKWDVNDLPIIPEKYELKVVENTKKQFQIVKKLLIRSDFEYVINAADAGREGELIFDNVYRLSGSKLDVKRLWTSAALTETAIRREFERLKPSSQFDGLRLSARVRAASDWVIGINATRALTLHARLQKGPISIGRVQTPTLSFLVHRELEIRNFKPKDFWMIEAEFSSKTSTYLGTLEFKQDETFSSKIFDKTIAEEIFCKIKSQKIARISDIQTVRKKIITPELFDLTELQKEANKIFGYTADETLKFAQNLYEKHKVLSYPRTDFKHLNLEMKKDVQQILNSLIETGENKEYFSMAIKNSESLNPRIFDDSKVGDHHALLPMVKRPVNLNEGEFNIYSCVLKRLLAALNNDHIFDETSVKTIVDVYSFLSKGKSIIENGWKNIYHFKQKTTHDKENKEQIFNELSINQSVFLAKTDLKYDKTKPPQYLSESDLLSCMQNPQHHIKTNLINSSQKNILKEKGLGTPATRAQIIKTLIERNYALRKGKHIFPTEFAVVLIQNLKPQTLTSPIMTAEWEEKLSLIEQKKLNASEFATKLNSFVKEIITHSEGCGQKLRKFNALTSKPKS